MPSREISFRSACNQLPRHLNWVRGGCSIPMSKRHPLFFGLDRSGNFFFIQPHANALLFGSVFIDTERETEKRRRRRRRNTWELIILQEKKKFVLYVPSRSSLSRVHEILISIRPRLSVWSHPHKWGTLSVQRLCTFISHAAHTNRPINRSIKRQRDKTRYYISLFVVCKHKKLAR